MAIEPPDRLLEIEIPPTHAHHASRPQFHVYAFRGPDRQDGEAGPGRDQLVAVLASVVAGIENQVQGIGPLLGNALRELGADLAVAGEEGGGGGGGEMAGEPEADLSLDATSVDFVRGGGGGEVEDFGVYAVAEFAGEG